MSSYETIIQKALAEGGLLDALLALQKRDGYVSEAGLSALAAYLGKSAAELYDTASFYSMLRFTPPAKKEIRVCRGTACHVRKSSTVLQALYEATGTDENKPNSDDGLFTLEIVSCLGACGLSPVVMVNDTVHAAMTPDKARALVSELRGEA